MGAKNSKSKSQPATSTKPQHRDPQVGGTEGRTNESQCCRAKYCVPKDANRRRSYIAAPRTEKCCESDKMDVCCLIANKEAREETCDLCAMNLTLMASINRSNHPHGSPEHEIRENEKRTYAAAIIADLKLDHHVCTKCNAVLCLECGNLLNQILSSFSKQELAVCGGCMLIQRQEIKRLRAETDKHSAVTRRHDNCPRCNTFLQDHWKLPFLQHVAKLTELVDITFRVSPNSSFVIVDITQIPTEKKLAVIEEAASPVPLAPLEQKQKRLSDALEFLTKAEGGQLPSTPSVDKLAEMWFILGESLYDIQTVLVGERKVRRIDCYAKAVEYQPEVILYLNALVSNMSKRHKVVIEGVPCIRYQIARMIIALRKNNPEAWRNAGIIMDIDDTITLDGETYNRNGCLRKSVLVAPTIRASWYAAALLMCPQTLTIPDVANGKELTRKECFEIMLDDTEDPNETFEEIVLRNFGKKFSVFVCSEVAFLCPNHPRVKAFASQFKMRAGNVLGTGAFGEVVRAYRVMPDDSRLELAAKLMNPSVSNNTLSSVPELYMLMSHLFSESVTRAFFIQHLPTSGRTTVFMELASYGSTQSYMTRVVHGRLYEVEVRAIFYQVLISLRMLHYHGVVHQDIKPANLLMFEDKTVKLADFGVTCMTYCDMCEMKAGGTEVYMPPEAYNKGTVSTAGDIWSLAATMIELASNHHPVVDPAFVHIKGAAHPYRPYVPDHLSKELKEILGSCLSYDPSQRPSAEELLDHPYFSMIDLPVSSEDYSVYPTAKGETGIPFKVRNMEELSSMGFDTRNLETMTRGTLRVDVMKQLKSQPLREQEEVSSPPSTVAEVIVESEGPATVVAVASAEVSEGTVSSSSSSCSDSPRTA